MRRSSAPRLALGLIVLGLVVGVPARGERAATTDPGRGALLYRRYCAVCHGRDGRGNGPNAAFLEDDQPRDLTDSRYIGRRSDGDLYRVIAEGGQAVQGSRFMPPWGRTLAPSEILDLVAYIRTLSTPAREKPASMAERSPGAGLARELGCPACHRIADLERTAVGPDLSAEGSRVQRAWLVRFLMAPHTVRPVGYEPLSRSRMPDFQLSREEAVSLADYLMTLRDGRAAPTEPVRTDLIEKGRALFRQYACRACHVRDGVGGRAGPDLSTVAQRLKAGWAMRLVQDPQALDPLSPMPRLGIDADAARAITSFLFGPGPQAEDVPPDAEAVSEGRRLFNALGCAGCHGREGGEARGEIGPDLSRAGEKLRPEWLSRFLARPYPIRPWLASRMPSFRLKGEEIQVLAEFVGSLKDETSPPLPKRLRFQGGVSEANVRAGRRLASREFLSCSSCHLGEEQPEGSPEELAPDLRISAERLNPDWIVRWLRDPGGLVAGTRMPAYFSDDTSGPEEILDGDEERQILALRDYILSLGSAHLVAQ